MPAPRESERDTYVPTHEWTYPPASSSLGWRLAAACPCGETIWHQHTPRGVEQIRTGEDKQGPARPSLSCSFTGRSREGL